MLRTAIVTSGGRFVGCLLILLLLVPRGAAAQGRDAVRTWKDASGKFEVKAKLVEQTAKEVRLETDKGREITVPIDRLSKADRDFLASVADRADNPFAGGKPAAGAKPAAAGKDGDGAGEKPGFVAAGTKLSAKTVLPGMGTTLALKPPTGNVPFTADPRPATPELPATAVPLAKQDYSSKFWGPVVTNTAEGRCLAAISKDGKDGGGKIWLVDLKGGECREVWKGGAARIWDHDEGTGITLVSEGLDATGKSPQLSVYSGFDSGSPKKLYERLLPGDHKYGGGPEFEWVAFAGPTLVAAVVENGLYVWDLAASKLVYRVDDVDEDAVPAFSGTKQQMAISQRSRVVVVETATGKVLRSIVTGGFRRAPVAFDASGTRLAMCAGNQFLVWDLVKNEAEREATTSEELGGHPISWVSPDTFLSGDGSLVHVGLEMVIWKYLFGYPSRRVPLGDKQLALVTSGEQAVVASMDVPHGPVEGVIAELDKLGDDDMVMLPGSPIRVSVEAPNKDDEARIAEWVSRALKRTGWKVTDDAPVTLVARIGQEKKQEIGIRDMDAGNAVRQVTLAPFFAELAIRRGSEVLWRRFERNHLPFILYLREGETAQQAVDRYTKPNAAFFAELRFPPRLPNQEVTKLVGTSIFADGRWK